MSHDTKIPKSFVITQPTFTMKACIVYTVYLYSYCKEFPGDFPQFILWQRERKLFYFFVHTFQTSLQDIIM